MKLRHRTLEGRGSGVCPIVLSESDRRWSGTCSAECNAAGREAEHLLRAWQWTGQHSLFPHSTSHVTILSDVRDTLGRTNTRGCSSPGPRRLSDLQTEGGWKSLEFLWSIRWQVLTFLPGLEELRDNNYKPVSRLRSHTLRLDRSTLHVTLNKQNYCSEYSESFLLHIRHGICFSIIRE